jgi:hypothetical protein
VVGLVLLLVPGLGEVRDLLTEGRPYPTSSNRIRSLIVRSVRRDRILWYSGELYHAFAVAMSGNASSTTESGHALSRTCTSAPIASRFPQ